MMIKRVIPAVALFACGLLLGCGGDEAGSGGGGATGGGGDNTALSGSISIEGSSTVEPISLKAKEEFNKQYPNVNIAVSGQGTGNGFKALAKKECDLSDASRPIKQKELQACQDAGQAFVEVPVAYDGLTIVVNNENDFVTQLTVEQLTKIFRKDMAAKTWKDVNPEWPDETITLYAPGVASGTHDYFMEVIGKDSESGMRDDPSIQKSEDDKILVMGVKDDKSAIGFFGYSYYEANKDDLKAVPIVNSAGEAVAPSSETIENGTYEPFSRPLFIYVSTESYKRAEVREFVDFYLANINDLVPAAGYVPLPAKVYEAARNHLDKELVGTHYVDANGEKREGAVGEVYQEGNLTK